MHTTVLHNHHICWTVCPSRKLVHRRSSKGVRINCLELIAANNFLEAQLPPQRWDSWCCCNMVCRLRTAVERKMLRWLYFCIFSLHDSVTLHTVKWPNSGSGNMGGKYCNTHHMVQTQYFKTSIFMLQRCESDEFGSVHFMWIFLLHFDVLAPAGADASVEALIMLKSSVHSCVCVC